VHPFNGTYEPVTYTTTPEPPPEPPPPHDGAPWFPVARDWSESGLWVRRWGWLDHSRWIRHEAGPGSARAVAVYRSRMVTTPLPVQASEFTEAEFRALDWTRTSPPFDPPDISLEVIVPPETTIDIGAEFPRRDPEVVATGGRYGEKTFGPWGYPIKLAQRSASPSWWDDDMVLNGDVVYPTGSADSPNGGANTTFLELSVGGTFSMDVQNNAGWCWAQGFLHIVPARNILRATVGDSWPEYPVALTFRGPDGGIVGEVIADVPGEYDTLVPLFGTTAQWAGKLWLSGGTLPITFPTETSCSYSWNTYDWACDADGVCSTQGVHGQLNADGTEIIWFDTTVWSGPSVLAAAPTPIYSVTASIPEQEWEATVYTGPSVPG
jgi:hypothetical protein